MNQLISNEQIMKLRNQTGAGIMDCKNALKEANGDMEKAVEILRKKGLSGLAKRAGREMKEGIVVIKNNNFKYVMVEIDCETDFVARNEEFVSFANFLAEEMLNKDNFFPHNDENAKEKLNNLAIKIGENMQIRKSVSYKINSSSVIGSYLHSDKKKAALVRISFEGNCDIKKIEEVAKNIAMQIVAMSPRWIRREDVPVEVIEKEKEIYKSSPQAQGKSDIALSKMIEGRINKFYQDVCLLEQTYIRDNKITVKNYIENLSKELGVRLNIIEFDLFVVGVE
ncbi:MAG: translation elongation factor Ts [Elusimicrobiales bacterium]|nr:translation elongation factor Ts [Elusimicrobiales bacterium]